MNQSASVPASPEQAPLKILCVDDEPNILSSLRRLFRSSGYHVIVAESGAAGLDVLENQSVDLVISDMRMPEMDGARFLEHVRSRWPDTTRLLLTGYSDVHSIIAAINRGEIYRYITKPWDDNDILLVVRQALERKALEQEKQRLEQLTLQQNEVLKALNASLESKVEERTFELKKTHEMVVAAHEKLKTSFVTSIKVFSNLIESRAGSIASGHSLRVANLARKVAQRMKLDAKETQDVFVSGLLHDIGKIGFPDHLLAMPLAILAGDNLGQFQKHPQRAEQLLMPLEDLRMVARILRCQRERYDGFGFPDKLAGAAIPLGARILAAASDYDGLQIGLLLQRRVAPDEALDMIVRGAGKRYDPKVCTAMQEVITGVIEEVFDDILVPGHALRAGMVLSRDLVSRDGALLVAADRVLDERLIQQIIDYDVPGATGLQVYIKNDRRK